MKKKRLIPFWMLPASWGLSGRSRSVAEAEYYYTGYDLEQELNRIHHVDTDSYNYQEDSLTIDHKNKKIDREEFLRRRAKLQLDYDLLTEEEYQVNLLEIDLEFNKISKEEFLKQKATILKEPYVNVLSMEINDEMPTQGAFELDWNEEFIKMLHNAGITGTSDEDVVNKWFNSVCRTVLLQSAADQDYGLSQPQGREDVLRKVEPGTKD